VYWSNPADWSDLTYAAEPWTRAIPYAEIVPQIDGYFSDVEWHDATRIKLNDAWLTLYLKADERYLYGCLSPSRYYLRPWGYPIYTLGDDLYLEFDNNFNGA